MAAKLARGAVLKVGDGTAPASVFVTVQGLGDVEYNPGEPQFADTTDHATPQGRTSRTPTHIGEATFSATLHYDGALVQHQQIRTDLIAMTLKSFRLHDPTSGSPGKRDQFTGYWSGGAESFPVSGLATVQIGIAIEPPIDTVDDV